MPASVNEPIFTAEQITIPPELAEVLKSYTKAAIRSNPADLLTWSQSYFEEKAGPAAAEVKGKCRAPHSSPVGAAR